MISSLLEVAGLLCIAVAGFLIYLPLGLALLGAALVLVGYLNGDSDVDSPS